MDSNNLRIIVLHSFSYKESGVILKGYTNCGGRDSFFIRVGKRGGKGGGRELLSALHPLSLIEGDISTFRLGELKTLKEVTPLYQLLSIRSSIVKSAIALFLSELISKTIYGAEGSGELFSFIENSIINLEKLEEGVANFHLHFLLKLSSFLGYMPEVAKRGKGMLFDIESATYEPKGGSRESLFPEAESELLWRLANSQIEQLKEIQISRELRYSFIEKMIGYIGFHQGGKLELNSLTVLHELFD